MSETHSCDVRASGVAVTAASVRGSPPPDAGRPIVIKFGGTSLATPARVRLAARRVRAHVRRGRKVTVVVSAAGRSTDGILARAARLGRPGRAPAGDGVARELDRALATGEDRSAALLAMALCSMSVPARSLRGGEARIRADGCFGGGSIVQIDVERLHLLLDGNVVPVVSGFQGERPDGETVTLGRGGSDTSAVALAAAIGASCDIVTDVDAVYDRDPACASDARPFEVLDHAGLVALVEGGAQVVHPAAARLAAEARVPLRVYHYRAPLSGGGTRIQALPIEAEVRTRLGGAA